MKTRCKMQKKVMLPKGFKLVKNIVKTVEAIKRKAAEAGIPYQTYVNVLLDNAALA